MKRKGIIIIYARYLEHVIEGSFFLNTQPECLSKIENRIQLFLGKHVHRQNALPVQGMMKRMNARRNRSSRRDRSRCHRSFTSLMMMGRWQDRAFSGTRNRARNPGNRLRIKGNPVRRQRRTYGQRTQLGYSKFTEHLSVKLSRLAGVAMEMNIIFSLMERAGRLDMLSRPWFTMIGKLQVRYRKARVISQISDVVAETRLGNNLKLT